MSSEVIVIIPTYNEAGNIVPMLQQLLNLPIPVDVLIVDDGSPDGTAELVKKEAQSNPGRIHLAIYDIQGTLVKTLVNHDDLKAGDYRMQWDGKNGFGRRVASGVYIARIEAGKFTQAIKMNLVK